MTHLNWPKIAAQRVEDEISRMKRGEVPLNQLIVGRKVRYETGNHRVMNLTAGLFSVPER